MKSSKASTVHSSQIFVYAADHNTTHIKGGVQKTPHRLNLPGKKVPGNTTQLFFSHISKFQKNNALQGQVGRENLLTINHKPQASFFHRQLCLLFKHSHICVQIDRVTNIKDLLNCCWIFNVYFICAPVPCRNLIRNKLGKNGGYFLKDKLWEFKLDSSGELFLRVE